MRAILNAMLLAALAWSPPLATRAAEPAAGEFTGQLKVVLDKALFQGAQPGGRRDFFVVITFQPTDPPQVKISGKGLDARVTVGRQTVRFDGEKIILGQP